MNSDKFTKGPWNYTISKHGRRQISGQNGKQICILWNSDETEMNAKLITYAPEMLKFIINLIQDKTCNSTIKFQAKLLYKQIVGKKYEQNEYM